MSSEQPRPKNVAVKSGRYYFVPRINGKKKWIPLSRVEDGRAALEAAMRSLEERPKPRTVADLLARFALEGREERADTTWHSYSVVATSPNSKVLKFFGAMRVESVKTEHVAEFLQFRKEEKRGPSGNREIAALASAFDWGARKRLSPKNPCRGVRRNKERKSHYRIKHESLEALIDSVKPYMQNFLCVLYLTGFRMGDMFRLKRENLSKDWLEIIERKNNVQHFKYYTKTLTYFLDRALEHSALMAEKYRDGDISEFVFTNRYGKPLTYFGLRSAIRIAGNPFPLRQIRALAESDSPGTLGHTGQMQRLYTRTVRTKPVK